MMHWWRWRWRYKNQTILWLLMVMVVLALDGHTSLGCVYLVSFFTDSRMVTHRCKNHHLGEYIYIYECIIFLATAESKQFWDFFPLSAKSHPFCEPSQFILRCWVEQTSLWGDCLCSFLDNRQFFSLFREFRRSKWWRIFWDIKELRILRRSRL